MFPALLLALLSACHRPPHEFPHEAYVWQRQWTPAVTDALAAQSPQFAGWRVLALQVIGERVIEIAPDFTALAATGLPVRAVVRIEGARAPLAVPALSAALQPLLQRWRAAGVRVTGVEIDHDCASAALADYTHWLRRLRATLPGDELSITALPAWLDSPALPALLAAVDSSVLQVHAVDRPAQGLFDENRAFAWTTAWNQHSPRPFQLALPAYGVRVATDATGAVHAVDAEGVIDRSGPAGRELRADPRAVAALLARLADAPPKRLQGYVWFRLPVAGDQRGWSARTLAAVQAGVPLQARFVIESKANAGGSVDLALRNDGNLDHLPPPIGLPAHCRLGDALGRYRLQHGDDGLSLSPDDRAWLPAGHRIRIGWVRCEHTLEHEWSIQ